MEEHERRDKMNEANEDDSTDNG